jgi:hypothetical protein
MARDYNHKEEEAVRRRSDAVCRLVQYVNSRSFRMIFIAKIAEHLCKERLPLVLVLQVGRQSGEAQFALMATRTNQTRCFVRCVAQQLGQAADHPRYCR